MSEDWAKDAMCGHVDVVVKIGAPEWRTCVEPVDPRSDPNDPRCTGHFGERKDR